MLDTDDLRAALHGLADGQPPQPADRLPRVVSRATRLRRTRTGAAALAVLAVAALAVPVVRATVPPDVPAVAASAAPAAVPVDTWPDRSRAADRPVADGAVAAWVRESGAPLGDVRWLFRGTVPRGDGTSSYVAAFLSRDAAGPVVVVAHADRDQLDGQGADTGEGGDSPWVLRSAPVPPPGRPVSTSLDGSSNAVLVLADPAARSLTYRTTPLPYASAALAGPAPVRTGTLSSSDGVFTGALGPLDGTVRLSVADGASTPLGMPGDAPALRPPDALDVPAGAREGADLAGTAQRQRDGTLGSEQVQDHTGTPAGRSAVYARCYGGGTLVVRYRGDRGRTPCDGVTHVVIGPARRPAAASATLLVAPAEVQAYRVGAYLLR